MPSALAILIAIAPPSNAQIGQFAPPVAPPPGVVFDNVSGEVVNFETQLTTPILVTRNGQYLVVANEPDNRVNVYSLPGLTLVMEVPVGQGICAIAERPVTLPATGEIWVTLRHQMATLVITPSAWRITHLLRPPVLSTAVGAREADNPGGVAFHANGTRAYVSCSNTQSLAVFDAVNKTFLLNVALASQHNGVSTGMNDPLCVAAIGTGASLRICVASAMSGNQSRVRENPTSALPPPTAEVVDLTTSTTESLPDFDLMLVNPSNNTVVAVKKVVGSMIFGLAYHAGVNRILATHFDSRNAAFIGERSFTDGKVVFNRLTLVDPNGPPAGPHTSILLENLVPAANPPVNVVMPTDVTIGSNGWIFVAGYASANIGVFDSAGAFLGVMSAHAGPRGLAFSATQNRVYCLNRAANSVTYYDLAGGVPAVPTGSFTLSDPTFDRVKQGRILFNTHNSGKGTAFCGSCHPDSRKDGLAWDLSKYHDAGEGFSLASPPQFWQDRKGVMVTQDLRSLAEVPPYHWRGEQLDLDAFNDAFKNLLKGTKMSTSDFALLQDFVFSCVYPANPFQQMNRNFTTAGANGASQFLNFEPVDSLQLAGQTGPITARCVDCHALPTGTDCSITDPLLGVNPDVLLLPAAVKTTQMRGMWAKESPITNISKVGAITLFPATGFGFEHNGLRHSAAEFIDFFFSGTVPTPQRNDLKTFANEFDSGIAPAVHFSDFVTSANATNNLAQYLVDQANFGHCDIAVKGRMLIAGAWRDLGMTWDRAAANFKVDDATAGGPFTLATLKNRASLGQAELLFFGVPVGSGERIGVDRDRDRVFDRDEILLGTDPRTVDFDGDGIWDGEDPSPTGGPNGLPTTPPSVVAGSVRVVYVTTNSAKITYDTDRLSPTRIEWGETSPTNAAGDPFPLPTGPLNTSNLWKRRHTALVRRTENDVGVKDGVIHVYRILTQGQNGVIGNTTTFTTGSLLADHHPINVRVSSLTAVHVPGTLHYSVTVTVVNNAFVPVSQAEIRPRWTFTVGGVSATAFPVKQDTDASGMTTFQFTAPAGHTAGDKVIFDIPMTRFQAGFGEFSGVVKVGAAFAWPENEKSSIQIDF